MSALLAESAAETGVYAKRDEIEILKMKSDSSENIFHLLDYCPLAAEYHFTVRNNIFPNL